MLVVYEAVLLLITALVVGAIGNLVGIGGGVLIMVVLLFLFKLNPLIAGGLSLITILASATVGSVSNVRQEAISRSLFAMIALFAGIGALVGSVSVYYISTKPFELLFGFVSISIGMFSVLATRRDTHRLSGLDKSFSAADASERDYMKRRSTSNKAGISAVAIIAGIIAGLFGIGIGGIMGTYLTAIRKVNPKIAFSSVLAAMIVTSLLGSPLHLFSVKMGLGIIAFIVALVIGAACGAIIGAYTSSKVRSGRLRFMQGYIIVGLGIITLFFSLLNF
ncbi:MAG: sulfite exporter TauE/SafE family protein [Candidatus Marsarchaeota archaeon]|jgi:uncharacterized membrane protein YfcA|nr:sulfite exporter TauE/SafE family protein [Candidatus Marsarchaeota archaeon]MCL5419202.1 sulfite exporter TauE/SafE family protein [Candidatus Marsarchaeota archaeon]